MKPFNPLLPVTNFVASVLVLLPIPRLFHPWNIGNCIFAIWTSVSCIIHGINAILSRWTDGADNIAPVWCDIGRKLRSTFWIVVLFIYCNSNEVANRFKYRPSCLHLCDLHSPVQHNTHARLCRKDEETSE